MRLRPRSIRIRLTLWYTGALALALALFAVAVYAMIRASLIRQLDGEMDAMAKPVLWMLRYEPDELGEVASHGGALLLRGKDALGGSLETLEWKANGLNVCVPNHVPKGLTQDWVKTESRPYRLLTFDGPYEGASVQLSLAKDAGLLQENLLRVRNALLLSLPLTLVLAALGGWMIARRLLAPIGAVADKAAAISANRLHERLPIDNPEDEIGRLTSTLNTMLTRLEASFVQMQRFVADASHELRTPLAALRSLGEASLMGPGDNGALRETVADMLEEAQRLKRLVEALLLLARADAGQIPIHRERFSLPDLTRETLDIVRALAEEKHQSLDLECIADIDMEGDRALLQQALLNLLDNAIKFTPEEGHILVRIESDGVSPGTRLEVLDTGPGIPPKHREEVFDRFYRVDKARARDERGGAGLGLAIARWAAEIHGGSLTCRENPQEGAAFVMTLPAVVRSDSSAISYQDSE